MYVSGETAEASPETTGMIEEIVRQQVIEMVSFNVSPKAFSTPLEHIRRDISPVLLSCPSWFVLILRSFGYVQRMLHGVAADQFRQMT